MLNASDTTNGHAETETADLTQRMARVQISIPSEGAEAVSVVPAALWAGIGRELDRQRLDVEWYQQRERDICRAVGGVSDGGRYRNDIIAVLERAMKNG